MRLAAAAAPLPNPPGATSAQNVNAKTFTVPSCDIDDVAASLRDGAGQTGQVIAVTSASSHIATAATALSLARELGRHGSAVLVALGGASSEIDAATGDEAAPGVTELAEGIASFSDVISKDRLSSIHVIAHGAPGLGVEAIMAAPAIGTGFDALARSYDYVVIDAGTVTDLPLAALSAIAPHAILIADVVSNPATAGAHERLHAAGFADVTMVIAGPEVPRAAAA